MLAVWPGAQLVPLARRLACSPCRVQRLTRSPALLLPASLRPFSTSPSRSSQAYKVVASTSAPKAIGPYSQAVIHKGIVYCSGCIPLDPQTTQVVEGGIAEQAEQVMRNLSAVLEEAGSKTSHILKATVFLQSMDDFSTVNAIYEKYMGEDRPARSTIEVARLPRNVLVEIECIAAVAE